MFFWNFLQLHHSVEVARIVLPSWEVHVAVGFRVVDSETILEVDFIFFTLVASGRNESEHDVRREIFRDFHFESPVAGFGSLHHSL